jgi:nucleoside-diphosphate-sugar epimerase
MTGISEAKGRQTAFVTGATGLLGNNLVRALVAKGVTVRALVRSRHKAEKQFPSLSFELVEGDINQTETFADRLPGVDTVFHTAAYFRDNYKGGRHWQQLYTTNVAGTASLLEVCYRAGIRRFVHTSSTAVLRGRPGEPADETMLRDEKEADDYQRSKILADREVLKFLEAHPDFWAAFVLPGWIHGPGDFGPTSAGQTVLDYLHKRLPGTPPGGFSVVDARDVADALIQVGERGMRGSRYIVAGKPMTMAEIFATLEKVSGVPAPRSKFPMAALYLIGGLSELQARLTGTPALLSWATVQLIAHEGSRNEYDHTKSERELGIRFRDVEETLQDEIEWFKGQGLVRTVISR